MLSSTDNLFGTRLCQARKLRGLALRDLVARLGGVVSAAALHKYEKGEMLPSAVVLRAICEALAMPEDFFFRPLTTHLGEMNFRKKTALRVKEEESVKERASDFFERFAELEDLMGLTARFENPLVDFAVEKAGDVEEAARRVRQAWGMGTGPVSSVVGLLEEKQILVYLLEAPGAFDGLAGKAGERHAVALNASFPIDRRRFSGLHELGHMVLKFAPGAFTEKEQEKLCHRFAGAFALPAESFTEAFGGYRQHVALGELVKIKSIYGISCAAILMRAAALGLLAESTLTRIWTRWAPYRKNDPGTCAFEESPRQFKLLLYRALAEERISRDKAEMLAGDEKGELMEDWEVYP